MIPFSDKIVVTIGSDNDLSPVQCQAIACKVGLIQFQNWNCSSIQIPELEMELKWKMELERLEFEMKTMWMNLEFYYSYWNTLYLTNHSQKLNP